MGVFKSKNFLHLNLLERGVNFFFMVEVKKKDNESFESMLRRFNRKIQQSGVLIRARKTRFFQPEKSRNLQKVAARRRSQIRVEKEELKKMGKPMPVKKYGRR